MSGFGCLMPNSIHYWSPYEDIKIKGDVGVEEDHVSRGTQWSTTLHHCRCHHSGAVSSSNIGGMRSKSELEADIEVPVSVASSLLSGNYPVTHNMESVISSVKTLVKPR